MRHVLRRHPDSLGLVATQIEVEVAHPRAGRLELSYVVTGRIGDLRLPPVVAATRTDELWRHTCFEAFVQTAPDGTYYEFNFAPSTQWAAYRFDGYRSGMRAAAGIVAPVIDVQSRPDGYVLNAVLDLDGLPDLARTTSWSLGLSALIEDTRGHLSYWALSHPPGKPDFHHSNGFAHALFPTVRP
jgi:hypothetical protein